MLQQVSCLVDFLGKKSLRWQESGELFYINVVVKVDETFCAFATKSLILLRFVCSTDK